MAVNLRVQVTIPSVSGGPADISVNTWHFTTPSFDTLLLDQITGNLKDFYTALASKYPAGMNLPGAGVKMYDLADPKPRPPVYEVPLGVTTPGGGASAPPEVACCFSFYSLRTAGVPGARTRNRVYIGPFNTATGGVLQPPALLITAMVSAGETLLAGAAASSWDWVIWSQRDKDLNPNYMPPLVVGGYVDNAWDTQRRRGVAPTTKSHFGSLPTGATAPAIADLGIG